MTDTTHLAALQRRLSHERARLKSATSANEIATRTVWVAQALAEVDAELKFLGMTQPTEPEMTDDELLAALTDKGSAT